MDTEQHTVITYAWYQLLLLDAARGHRHECLERASEIFAAVARTETYYIGLYADAAVGLLHLGLGELDAAIGRLERVQATTSACGAEEPAITNGTGNLIEAYARAGRGSDAALLLQHLEAHAGRSQRQSLLATAARCRGLLDAENFDRHFEEALDRHAALPSAFERARTQAAYGERLRHAGRRTVARPHLRAALAAFEELGAASWAARATNELPATGERIARRPPDSTQLTPQEQQIARLVATGISNREVAATLFLSSKTVERHLSNAFRKTGTRSCTQLARMMVDVDGAPMTGGQ